MEHFTPFGSALGGVLIGASSALLLFGLGRIAGISTIFGSVVIPRTDDLGWRIAFLAGLVLAGAGLVLLAPSLFAVTVERSLGRIALAGLLVGLGTRLGNGCTSGHGVCGLSRLSTRSLVATLTFMATGGLTVFVVQHVLGGAR